MREKERKRERERERRKGFQDFQTGKPPLSCWKTVFEREKKPARENRGDPLFPMDISLKRRALDAFPPFSHIGGESPPTLVRTYVETGLAEDRQKNGWFFLGFSRDDEEGKVLPLHL